MSHLAQGQGCTPGTGGYTPGGSSCRKSRHTPGRNGFTPRRTPGGYLGTPQFAPIFITLCPGVKPRVSSISTPSLSLHHQRSHIHVTSSLSLSLLSNLFLWKMWWSCRGLSCDYAADAKSSVIYVGTWTVVIIHNLCRFPL